MVKKTENEIDEHLETVEDDQLEITAGDDDEVGDADESETVVEDGEAAEGEGEQEGSEDEGDPESGDDADALVVSLDGDDSDDDGEGESSTFREMRKELRDAKRKLKELEKGEEQAAATAEVGEKPTLEDFDFDQGKFETALLDWSERKKTADAEVQAEEAKVEKMRERHNERVTSYKTASKALPVKDFDDVESTVKDTLSLTQQSIIVAHAKAPEVVVYALGKNPKKAAELAAETDPIAFAFKLAQLESTMKVKGKMKPQPERKAPAGKSAPVVGEAKLEKARAAAEKSGDYTEVRKIKQQMKEAARA